MFERNVKFATYALYAVAGLLFIGAIMSFAANKGIQQAVEPSASMTRERIAIVAPDGSGVRYNVEIAVTPEQMDRGLMFREKLDKTAGMLFIYNRVEEHSMWMKDTQIPLDMVFIDNDGKISRIRENARPYDLRAISSITPARAVLEINAGQVQEQGIKLGDKIESHALSNFQGVESSQPRTEDREPVSDE